MTFLPLALLLLACSNKDADCATDGHSDWAIQFSFEAGADGSCPYEGTLELEGEQEVEPLSCTPKDDGCHCEGGSEFGTYHITLTNTEAGTTQRAVIEVTREVAPVCLDRNAIEPFSADAMGGAGGAGGTSGATGSEPD